MAKEIGIDQLMTKKVIVAKRYNTLFQVKEMYLKFNIHHLPVVNEVEDVIGIITTSDLLRFYAKHLPNKEDVNVVELEKFFKIEDFMTKNPITLEHDKTVREAINKFHALPIVKNRKVVGIVTSNDLLHFTVSEILSEK